VARRARRISARRLSAEVVENRICIRRFHVCDPSLVAIFWRDSTRRVRFSNGVKPYAEPSEFDPAAASGATCGSIVRESRNLARRREILGWGEHPMAGEENFRQIVSVRDKKATNWKQVRQPAIQCHAKQIHLPAFSWWLPKFATPGNTFNSSQANRRNLAA